MFSRSHGGERMHFPVGYRAFHPEPNFNFELNRWLAALPEHQVRSLAARIETAADWKGVMLDAAHAAEQSPARLSAAFYYRAAEFFMHPRDPDKQAAYDRFIDL